MAYEKYLQAQAEGNDILFFGQPDAAALRGLQSALEELEIRPQESAISRAYLRARVFKGNLSSTMASLAAILRDDYQENTMDEDLNVDYQVLRSNRQPNTLHINTRLFYPGQGSSLFYGRMVQRVDRDEYLLLTDEDASAPM